MSSLTLFGCVQWDKGFPEKSDAMTITLTDEYGEGGTILPKKLRYMVDQGFTTVEELTKKFGEPQNIESYDWGQLVIYRHWSNKIGKERLEEKWVFQFNKDGFFDHFVHSVNNNPIETDRDKGLSDKEAECNPVYILCQSYGASSSSL